MANEERIAALEAVVTSLQNQVASLFSEVANLQMTDQDLTAALAGKADKDETDALWPSPK